MKRAAIPLIFIFIFSLFSCNNERKKDDSSGKKKNSSLLNAFDQTLKQVHNIDSLYYLTDKFEHQLIDKKSPDSIMALFYHKSAIKFYSYSKFGVAMEYFQKAEQAYDLTGDMLMSVKMKGNQAVLLDLQGNYKKAIEILLEVSDYFQRINDTLPLAFAYSNIGVIYEELKNPEKAIAYGKKAMKLKLEVGDTLKAATNLNNIGVNFEELIKNADSAIYYYEQAFVIYKRYNKIEKYATVLDNIGRMYLSKGFYEKAANNFLEAYKIFDSIGNKNKLAAVVSNQGELYFYHGDTKLAVEKIQQAFRWYKESGIVKGQVETAKLLSKIYMAEGRYGKASEMMQQYNQLNDSLLNTENQAVIAELETKYQVKEKTRIIKLLQLQNQLHTKQIKMQTLLIISMIVVVILLIVLFFSHYKRTGLKEQKLRLELQNYLLQIAEMEDKLKNRKENCGEKSNLELIKNYNLSKQELKVISLIAEGFKNAEIAEKLFVSQNTVKTHIKNIYSKLDVKNRVEALRKVSE